MTIRARQRGLASIHFRRLLRLLRLLITGASGTGTSTLGRVVAEALHGEWLDADDYYWLPTEPPFQVKRTPTDRLALMLTRLRRTDRAVVSGSVVNWGSELEDSFDLVVFLTAPTTVRLERLKRREERLRRAARREFLEWAAQYDEGHMSGRSRAIHETWLERRRCSVLRIDGDHTMRAMLEMVLAALPAGSSGR